MVIGFEAIRSRTHDLGSSSRVAENYCNSLVDYWFDLLTSRMATTQVIDRRRGATLSLLALPGWALKGMTPYNEGSFTCKRVMGILHGATTVWSESLDT